MCFKNLPIVFDEEGHARLIEDSSFAIPSAGRPARSGKERSPPRKGREFRIDPVTRVAGALAFHTQVDLESGVVFDAHSEAVLFRGYELILKGRDPLEAIDISSRACGVCGGVHSTCASMALEMTFGVAPPPLAVVARNVAEAVELLYDHCLHLFLLAGPDYSEVMVTRTNPQLWTRARQTGAERSEVHGFSSVADIMTALNPLQGALTLEALQVTRSAREIISLLFGKYPHPSSIVPAGLGTVVDQDVVNQALARAVSLVDFAKRVVAIWEDLTEFFYQADPQYRRIGERSANFITTGLWDDPESYDASYANVDSWGSRRLSRPGVFIDGELRTSRLSQINLGIEEFVSHSFYAEGATNEVGAAPDGSPLSPYHPWNRRTIPRPAPSSWKDRYSWSTSPRWDRLPMESGPIARQWATAVLGGVHSDFLEATGDGTISIHLPTGSLPEMVVEWRVPETVNAFERNRARAVHVSYCLMIAYHNLLLGLDLLRTGETAMANPFQVTDGIGVGLWEAGRGSLTHFCVVEDGRLRNYQILTPSTWMASPRDPWETPGPYEDAVVNTPILEDVRDPDEFVGIDILRAIRSFDPCMPCTVHMYTGKGTVVRDATTCMCGEDKA